MKGVQFLMATWQEVAGGWGPGRAPVASCQILQAKHVNLQELQSIFKL